jgi:hypothetical protein
MSAGCEAGITSFAVSENSVSHRAKYLSSMGKGKCEEGDCPYIAPWSAKQWTRSLSGEPNEQMSVVLGIFGVNLCSLFGVKLGYAGAGGVVGRDSGYCVITLPAA